MFVLLCSVPHIDALVTPNATLEISNCHHIEQPLEIKSRHGEISREDVTLRLHYI